MTSSYWAIILAAGKSARFGSPKALALWNDKTLLGHMISTAQSVVEQNVLIVTGAYDFEQKEFSAYRKVKNNFWNDGIGSSISCGVREVLNHDPQADRIIILTVDQPLVSGNHIKNILTLSNETQLSVFTSSCDVFGPPAVIVSPNFEDAMHLCGHKGLKSIMKEFRSVENAMALQDIDTPEDWERLRNPDFVRAIADE